MLEPSAFFWRQSRHFGRCGYSWSQQLLIKKHYLAEFRSVRGGLHRPGRGPSVTGPGAKRIIKNRPFETIEEVVQQGVLPEEILDRVKDQLVDKPAM